jgi:hypothetical protein
MSIIDAISDEAEAISCKPLPSEDDQTCSGRHGHLADRPKCVLVGFGCARRSGALMLMARMIAVTGAKCEPLTREQGQRQPNFHATNGGEPKTISHPCACCGDRHPGRQHRAKSADRSNI